jgi:hypothetical protein
MADREVIVEPGKILVRDPDLDLQYELWGQAPVQALGTFLGHDIYFRARHDEWTFEVADDDGNLPSDGKARGGYFCSGAQPDASYMPLEKAMRIIDRCIHELVTPKRVDS